ncbi:MAG TPA: PxKF domain-containing protein [Candidatus Paceibacterota bacterium]|nr:PxKF domain-containing protein [Candidatus Paceibacterota bacterium]
MHIRHFALGTALLAVAFAFTASVLANSTNLSFDPAHGAGPFTFYCAPHTSGFTSGGTYQVNPNGPCVFSVPNALSGNKNIAIYKGEVGSATFVVGDLVTGSATLVQEDTVPFENVIGSDVPYFAVIWSFDQFGGSNGALGMHLANGANPLPEGAEEGVNYFILPWIWHTPPAASCTLTANPAAISSGESSILSLTSQFASTISIDNDVELFGTGANRSAFVMPAITTTYMATVSGPGGSSTCTVTVFVDEEPPPPPPDDSEPPVVTITSPAHGGTYLTTDTVFISATIEDGGPQATGINQVTYKLNGVVVNPAQPLPLSTSPLGSNTLLITAQDGAGNETQATSIFSLKAPLTVTAQNKFMQAGGPLPTFTYTVSGFLGADTLSNSTTGSASCTTPATASSPIGTYPITCTVGTLTSSNYAFTTFVAGTLTVGYKFGGFLQPINYTGHMVEPDISVFKAGSTVPVKIVLKDENGNVIQSATPPQWLTPQKGGPINESVDEAYYTDPATSGTTYEWKGTHHQFNWKTKSLDKGYWYRIYAKLDDGSIYSVTIGLR